jgi:hypothetical protein
MLQAVVDSVPMERVAAETDAEVVCFYVRCGFAASSAGDRGGRERFLCTKP